MVEAHDPPDTAEMYPISSQRLSSRKPAICPRAKFIARVPPPEKQTPVEGRFKLASGNSSLIEALSQAMIVALVRHPMQKSKEKPSTIKSLTGEFEEWVDECILFLF